MSVLARIFKEAKGVYSAYFEANDQLLSEEIKELLDDSEKRKAYFKAIDKLKRSGKKDDGVEIDLSNGKKIKISLSR